MRNCSLFRNCQYMFWTPHLYLNDICVCPRHLWGGIRAQVIVTPRLLLEQRAHKLWDCCEADPMLPWPEESQSVGLCGSEWLQERGWESSYLGSQWRSDSRFSSLVPAEFPISDSSLLRGLALFRIKFHVIPLNPYNKSPFHFSLAWFEWSPVTCKRKASTTHAAFTKVGAKTADRHCLEGRMFWKAWKGQACLCFTKR